jgi:pre-mRNA-splicing factor SYF1
MYATVLEKQQLVSKAREVYNWSFRNLPLTQHEKIWQKYSKWAMTLDNSSTALRVIPRYLKINPDYKETFAQYLIDRKLYDLGASVYKAILDDDGYHSKAGKDKKTFYFELMDLITQYPEKINCVDGYTFIRSALTLYPDDAGKVWVKASDYFIRLGEFDRAREVMEEAIESVENAKDFGIIFTAYIRFEE